jgi:DeoR/GlpR family transcriptional regulator of sugar metabolism
MTERQDRILEILAGKNRAEVSFLAETLEVSQVTIRKDLDYLEEMGFIQREHGFAHFGPIEDVGRRMAINYEIKRRIARAAAETVEEGETVMIESGSCCAMLAEELANSKEVIIITNSAFIANHVRHAPYANVILLGGEYQKGSQVLVGSMTSKWAEIFMSDKFFIGTDGFSEKYGFTGRDHQRTQTVRDMAQQAQKVIVLTDSDKFLRQGIEGLVRTEQVSMVFTDDRILPEKEQFLEERNVLIHKVQSMGRVSAEEPCKV